VGAAALAHRGTLVASIAQLLTREGYDGVHLDLEMLPSSSRSDLTALVQELAARVRPKTVTVSVFGPASPSVAWTRAYDYAALARASDGLVVMTYDEHGEAGPAGPIAGSGYMARNLTALLRQVPARKVILGLAAFGFDWPPSGPGQYISYADAREIAAARGVRIRSDTRLGAAWFRYRGPDGTHAVYFEDAATWGAKLALARRRHLGGVAIWRLGMEDPAAWPEITNYRQGR
jgi:spore germination protein